LLRRCNTGSKPYSYPTPKKRKERDGKKKVRKVGGEKRKGKWERIGEDGRAKQVKKRKGRR